MLLIKCNIKTGWKLHCATVLAKTQVWKNWMKFISSVSIYVYRDISRRSSVTWPWERAWLTLAWCRNVFVAPHYWLAERTACRVGPPSQNSSVEWGRMMGSPQPISVHRAGLYNGQPSTSWGRQGERGPLRSAQMVAGPTSLPVKSSGCLLEFGRARSIICECRERISAGEATVLQNRRVARVQLCKNHLFPGQE